jgi:hypothetical protein
MSEELTNEAVDSAVILENRVNERVRKEVALTLNGVLKQAVTDEVRRIFKEQKEIMLMEIAITVGKTLRTSDAEYRKPLWESTPEELGLTPKDLNSHMLGEREEDHAIRKQT